MGYTTLTVRDDIARRLKALKAAGESYSDTLTRLLDNLPAKTVGEWLESLAPLEGRGVLSPEARQRLQDAQRAPLRSRRRPRAAP